MDLVAGALGKLPSKLLELLKDEYNLQAGVKEEIVSLSRELEDMHAALCKVAQVPTDQLDPQVRLWARDVREASYDVEDVLDTFLVRVDGGGPQPADANKLKRLLKKMGKLFSLSKAKARHDIAGAIEDIRKKLQEMHMRRASYRVDEILAKPAATTSIDPRLSALYTKVSKLVGIDEPRDKVIQMLSVGDDDVSDKETKIVCVVGFGGLGKTTLAKAVYEKLTEKNPDLKKAFVPVGRNPDLKKVLKDILIDLDKERYTTQVKLKILDEKQLIDELREFLKDKRYFIVIDDIWDVPSWNIIRYAFDDDSLGSKIIITTRSHYVAEKVSCSYKMEPLLYESSKILFYERIFGSEDKCPGHLLEVCEKILKKCGGVPLAIITISSLLANKSSNIKEWFEVCDSIGSGLGNNHDMDNMRKILSLSYYDLPSHLKTCLLYLSVFPEDYNIYRYRLILRWIAEDFVQLEEGSQSLFEVGENYFTELINRSLIQSPSTDVRGKPWGCHVHDMVLDLICSLSREESFVTGVFGDIKQNTPSGCEPSSGSNVRRLSLSNTTWPTTNLPKLRSLTIFDPAAIINSVPSLPCYHLLRVLDLEECNLRHLPSLKFVGNLLHLRYLGLCHTRYAGELPAEIGKLQFLQTLDLAETDVKKLPSSIVELRQLKYLFVNWDVRLPDGLRNLTSLEILEMARVDSTYIAKELGYLMQLRELWVSLAEDTEGGWDESMCTALVESLGKLHKIQDLAIFSYDVTANLEGSVESLSSLRHLYIHGTSSLPTWINPASLLLLSIINIRLDQVRTEDIQVLGMLKALHDLKVDALGFKTPTMKRSIVSADAFPCVINCSFMNFSTLPSMFPRGAMSRLEGFRFCIQLDTFSDGEFTVDDLAMGHLPSLQRVTVCMYGVEKVSKEVVTQVKEALKHEADVHPNHPSLFHEKRRGRDDSATEEEEEDEVSSTGDDDATESRRLEEEEKKVNPVVKFFLKQYNF